MDTFLPQLNSTWTLLASRLLPDDGGSVLPLVSTVIFVSFFVLMFLFVMTDRRRSHHRRMESLILDDGTVDVPPQTHSGEEAKHE